MLQGSKLSLHNADTIVTAEGVELANLNGVYEGSSRFQIHITVESIEQFPAHKEEILQNISEFIDQVVSTAAEYKGILTKESE